MIEKVLSRLKIKKASLKLARKEDRMLELYSTAGYLSSIAA